MSVNNKGKRSLELLAPASNAEVAFEAIKHGADAIYIGASSHGARKAASNSLADIRRVVEFAHKFRARVYVTINTVVFDNELKHVEKLCKDLYRLGVDALIVQDMSLLRLDLPPIALHASTQCDIRTPEKARFLQDVGFSQLVLARELSLSEIKSIVESVDIPVESFIHGALCVSYSGKCHASCAATGRSANRGECAQLCRLPYTLRDSKGEILEKDKYLLSLKDLNVTNLIPQLIKTGVSSFKIEGRLKDAAYVKNVVSHYNNILNSFIWKAPESYRRSSCGTTEISFRSDPTKSFNRGFTDYFLSNRQPAHIASMNTPKSLGEKITDFSLLNNGDGISYFTPNGEYKGLNVNRIEGGKILSSKRVEIPTGTAVYRTKDIEWQKKMSKDTAMRKISLDISVDEKGVTASDERGVAIRIPLDVKMEKARKAMDYAREFSRLGNTIYNLRHFSSVIDPEIFIPPSELARVRRNLVEKLDEANLATYPYHYRREEKTDTIYPLKKLGFEENVANSLAEKFYRDHGVLSIEKAIEVTGIKNKKEIVVMTTRHCILRETGRCKKLMKGIKLSEPLSLSDGRNHYKLKFDCANCEMKIIRE